MKKDNDYRRRHQPIKTYEVSPDVFDYILGRYEGIWVKVDSTDPYMTSMRNEKKPLYDGKEYMICLEATLLYALEKTKHKELLFDATSWKHVRLRRVEFADNALSKVTNGSYAWNYIWNSLDRYYTDEEKDACLRAHQAEYNRDWAQMHYRWMPPMDAWGKRIYSFDNTYKYDVNGAHNDALCEIFPKAKEFFIRLYSNRKRKPQNKLYVNYFVGNLVNHGYRETYNWIVQRTTHLLDESMIRTDGELLYANTDGYVVHMPSGKQDVSAELGRFKMEYSGTTYIFKDTNYWIMQEGDEMKGDAFLIARKEMDLRKGIVVHYDKEFDEMTRHYCPTNIRKEIAEHEKGYQKI